MLLGDAMGRIYNELGLVYSYDIIPWTKQVFVWYVYLPISTIGILGFVANVISVEIRKCILVYFRNSIYVYISQVIKFQNFTT